MITEVVREYDGFDGYDEMVEILEDNEARCAVCEKIFERTELILLQDHFHCVNCLPDIATNLECENEVLEKRLKESNNYLNKISEIINGNFSDDFKIGSIRGLCDIALI